MNSIIYVTNRFFPAKGGVEETVLQQAAHIRELYSPIVISSNMISNTRLENKNVQMDYSLKGKPNYEHHHIRSYHLPFSNRYYVGNVMPLLKHCTNIHIHIHGFWYFISDLTLLLTAISRMKVFWTPHFYARRGTKWNIYAYLISKVIHRVEIIFVSNYEKKQFYEYFKTRPLKDYVVGHGVSPEINRAFQKRKRVNNIKKDRFTNILFIGRLEYGKGIDLIIEIGKYIDAHLLQAKIRLIGSGKKYEDIISRSNINSIELLGGVSNSEKIDTMLRSDLFILPSRYEAFGIVLIEAMAMKLPIIAMDSSAISETLGGGRYGHLFNNNDLDSFKQLVHRCIIDDDFRVKKVSEAYSKVQNENNWKNIAKQLKQIYENAS
jgi:glycosyltransferase involved in cell wall biosynthesis